MSHFVDSAIKNSDKVYYTVIQILNITGTLVIKSEFLWNPNKVKLILNVKVR